MEEECKRIISVGENLSEKSLKDGEVIKKEEIKKILEEAGIQCYEPHVLTHLADYIEKYTADILNHASTFMKHAGRQMVSVADVQLAVDVVARKSPSKRLSRKELIDLAREMNAEKLPDCSAKRTFLPTDDYTVTKCNYKLKNGNTQFPVNFPVVDITNRQSQMVTFNAIKSNAGGLPTVIRTSTGTMSVNVPLNLPPQRIILKPQLPLTNLGNTCVSQNKLEDSMKKRIKLDDAKNK